MNELKTARLSPDCEDVLKSRDLIYEIQPGWDWAWIRDEEGNYVTRVTLGISVMDLVTMLAYGKSQFDRGVQVGMRALQTEFRNLMRIPDPM